MGMSKQAIFDKVAKHLMTQGCKAMFGGGSCQYKAPDGTSCAIGCLISSDLYDPDMEGNDFYSLAAKFRPIRTYLGIEMTDRVLGCETSKFALCESLQETHDMNEPETWARELKAVATRFGLSPSVVTRRQAALKAARTRRAKARRR